MTTSKHFCSFASSILHITSSGTERLAYSTQWHTANLYGFIQTCYHSLKMLSALKAWHPWGTRTPIIGFGDRHSTSWTIRANWSWWVGSNHRPLAYKARALTNWAYIRMCDDLGGSKSSKLLFSTFVNEVSCLLRLSTCLWWYRSILPNLARPWVEHRTVSRLELHYSTIGM